MILSFGKQSLLLLLFCLPPLSRTYEIVDNLSAHCHLGFVICHTVSFATEKPLEYPQRPGGR